MASSIGASSRATLRAAHLPKPLVFQSERLVFLTGRERSRIVRRWRIGVSRDGNSYLDMWKNAVDRERKVVEFQKIAGNSPVDDDGGDGGDSGGVDLVKKTEEFKKILEVSSDERDRIQRMQVVDRAAAAIAAARAILTEKESETTGNSGDDTVVHSKAGGVQNGSIFVSRLENSGNGVPGPDFWSWTPPPDTDRNSDVSDLQTALVSSVYPTSTNPAAVKERSMDFLLIPFESKLSETNQNPLIPPMQSLIEVEQVEVSKSIPETTIVKSEERDLGLLFSAHAAEAAYALDKDEVDELPYHGTNPDGSKWWKETGMERRPDGVICRWTMLRGVSVDQDVEWQEKFWEAADEFGYKELGSEKSGRDATGNVWREYWRESMWQDAGLVHLEKTADKWGKNGKGDEWQEKWWEHYDASGKADKWAHKWCSTDPTTQLEAGHAHVWHERWGEKYDGYGGSIKYTDKWAERCEDDGWTKWGDKWDENFDPKGHGVKQGETWWAGKHGEMWNRTWGERHNGSGWVHKYGKSSSGEHWDTHVEQETWYERFPHYGFYHCFDNSVQLQQVQKPAENVQPTSSEAI